MSGKEKDMGSTDDPGVLARQSTREPLYSAPLALSYDEEDVLRDVIGTTPKDDESVFDNHVTALSTLRLKVALHYSESRSVREARAAVEAVERIADHARNAGRPIRFYYHWDEMTHELRVGDRQWTGETLWTLVERVERELGVYGDG